ncbi:MAG: TIGR02391 family protein [Pseudomonadota bacterium]|nr:TIGR02391 family protein [Pseudomonadota bacterium]QKK06576.1 MAG: TIGR02391 family protein [Pseudomonadota bacterium]
MTDALLYVLGYKSNRNDDQKVDFLKYKKRVKRLTKYILDARQTGDLKLHGFDDHLYDHDQKDIEEKRLKSFYKSRVKPKEFITFLSGLSLDLPIIEQYIYPDEPTVEEASLPKPLEFEAILHPIIIKGAYKQYQNEHFRDAALNSIVAVFDYLREKTGLRDDGDRLVSKAFALENPFIILSNIATESGRNDQKGFMNIFKGAYLGIRNPKAHTLETNLTKEKTAQYLIFASLLARRIDEATFPKQNGNLGTKSGGTVLIK